MSRLLSGPRRRRGDAPLHGRDLVTAAKVYWWAGPAGIRCDRRKRNKISNPVSYPDQATQNPTHAPEPDALAAFVASLTPGQRVKLAALLLADPGGTADRPGDAD